jgi:hypothetical protein
MKTVTRSLLWILLLLAQTISSTLAQTDASLNSLNGPLIEKIDWEDKPVSEAAAELVDLVVKKDKNSPWRKVQIRKGENPLSPVTMHLRNVSAGEAFQLIADCALARMWTKNGTVELSTSFPKSDRVDEFGIQVRVIIVPEQAASRLALTASGAKQSLERFGTKFPKEGSKLAYSEATRELVLWAPPEECDFVAALVLLATRTDIVVRPK